MNIGLLMTYNEADIIEEMMATNRHAVDAIFALDGSDDGTDTLLAGYPEVKHIFKDKEVAPEGRVRDFHRQVLLDAARERYGANHWFTLMHGDELFHDDPRAAIARAERQGAKRINWAVMQFFPHTTDEPLNTRVPVQDRLRWYSPFWVEIRQFKGTSRTHYVPGKHGQVIPAGVGLRPYSKMPLLKHYPYRSPAQMRRRLACAATRGFSGTATQAATQESIYRSTYSREYKIARKFVRDFGPLELSRQGNLLTMLWRWKRWVRK